MGVAQESAIGAGYSVEDEHGLRLQDDACEVRPRLDPRCRDTEVRVARCFLCEGLGSALRLQRDLKWNAHSGPGQTEWQCVLDAMLVYCGVNKLA